MFCPHCGKKLTVPIGPSCGFCLKDIRCLAPALPRDTQPVSGEMTETSLFVSAQFMSADDLLKEDLEPGDLIEINRGLFKHWAVYVGDGDVVHLVAFDSGLGISAASSVISRGSVKGEVKREKLKIVANEDGCKVNNLHDSILQPRAKQQIVNQALSRVGGVVMYSVYQHNCEHFATECRYGIARSLQMENVSRGNMVLLASIEVSSSSQSS